MIAPRLNGKTTACLQYPSAQAATAPTNVAMIMSRHIKRLETITWLKGIEEMLYPAYNRKRDACRIGTDPD